MKNIICLFTLIFALAAFTAPVFACGGHGDDTTAENTSSDDTSTTDTKDAKETKTAACTSCTTDECSCKDKKKKQKSTTPTA